MSHAMVSVSQQAREQSAGGGVVQTVEEIEPAPPPTVSGGGLRQRKTGLATLGGGGGGRGGGPAALPLRPYKTPENERFLADVKANRVPRELVRAASPRAAPSRPRASHRGTLRPVDAVMACRCGWVQVEKAMAGQRPGAPPPPPPRGTNWSFSLADRRRAPPTHAPAPATLAPPPRSCCSSCACSCWAPPASGLSRLRSDKAGPVPGGAQAEVHRVRRLRQHPWRHRLACRTRGCGGRGAAGGGGGGGGRGGAARAAGVAVAAAGPLGGGDARPRPAAAAAAGRGRPGRPGDQSPDTTRGRPVRRTARWRSCPSMVWLTQAFGWSVRRLVGEFNHSHTVSDLVRFVEHQLDGTDTAGSDDQPGPAPFVLTAVSDSGCG